MKAIILAAGKGERLGTLTQGIPKPMIKIQGKPILEHNIELCRNFNIFDISINVHHLGHQIMDYFGDGSKFGVNIKYSIERELLGTAGAVKNIASKWRGEIDPFFVIYGDNLSNYNLTSIQEKASQQGSVATIGFHYRKDVATSGVAEFDDSGRIISFIEKPKPGETKSHWVNAGIYFLNIDIFKYIDDGYSDFASTVFPLLLAKEVPIFGVCNQADVKAFDTLEMLLKNFK